MIDPALVSAVLVTKGDVDLSRIIESIGEAGIKDIVIWNNAERDDRSCYGRYCGIAEAKRKYIFHQDDDLIVPVGEVLQRYDPKRDLYTIVSNNRPDEEWPLTAIGSVFHRRLALCFDPYLRAYGYNEDFRRVCDVVFAYSNAYRRIWVGYEDLPWQIAPDRMHMQPGHMEVRIRARLRTLALQ